MNPIQYLIFRYLLDRVSSEFVNLALVVYDPAGRDPRSKFVVKPERISQSHPLNMIDLQSVSVRARMNWVNL